MGNGKYRGVRREGETRKEVKRRDKRDKQRGMGQGGGKQHKSLQF